MKKNESEMQPTEGQTPHALTEEEVMDAKAAWDGSEATQLQYNDDLNAFLWAIARQKNDSSM